MKTSKIMTNLEIADLLRKVAAAYQLQDEFKNKFKIIAYERAADAVEHSSSELKDLWDEGKLEEVPGVGKSIARHLDELFRYGRVKHFENLTKNFPEEIFRLIKLPGIGPKTALKLVKEGVPAEIREQLIKIEKQTKRYLLPYAQHLASEIIAWLKQSPAVERIDPLGSLRRQASTIGDIDIAVASSQSDKVIAHFCRYPKAKKIIEKGKTTASILLPGEVRVDLMVQNPVSYGALLQHFTGSKHHNIALREYALKKGFSLSEYGIKKLKTKDLKAKSFSNEESFYKYLGLEWIPPELREDAGEIEASLNHQLPKLVDLLDIKSDLQIHSNFNIETSHDLGESTMEELVEEAGRLGYQYLAFTEHNPSQSKHREQQILDLLQKKKNKVEEINYSCVKSVKGSIKKVFNSLEIDILPDGRCPIPLKGFDFLDFALVSIHSSFRLPRQLMTRRILQALSWHPKVKILAHPTARRLNQREGIEVDWPEIFAFCRENQKWLEINADPVRLDLPDFLVREAVKHGVKLTLGTDAHHKQHLANMPYGVAVARRGWASKNDIINTLSLKEFEEVIRV